MNDLGEQYKNAMNGGTKYDQEKPKMEYLSSVWIEDVARVLSFGAKKYAAHNWRQGIAQSRLLGAALRHIFTYLKGEDLDPETGLSHLAHASCCLMFARELRDTRPDLDDRYKINEVTSKDAASWKVGKHEFPIHQCSKAPRDAPTFVNAGEPCPYCGENINERKD